MSDRATDIETLLRAVELLTETSRRMEEAYRGLETRVHDLTRELAEKNRELAVTTEYLSGLLESMTDGVVAVDNDGTITRFNRAAASILGYRGGEVVGYSFSDIFGRDFAAPRIPGEMCLRAKSGRMVPVSERDSIIFDESNRRLGRVKTFQDLSEIIALREQVRQVDRLAAVGEMAASVAHEIRNPLGGIRGFAELLAQDIAEEDPRKRLVEKILAGTRSLDRVVNELLEFTRPVELQLRPVSCASLVDAAAGFLTYDRDRIRLIDEIGPGVRVLADPDKMRQVFLNVLVNAVQSISDTGEIRISASVLENYVMVTIRDTGCGMTPAQLREAFTPFFTTKEKGSGLGLAVSRKIVEGHGGRITADSTLGRGTAVTVQLPRAE